MSEKFPGKIAVETTGEAYLRLLRRLGVRYLFGNAGTDFAPIIEAYAKLGLEGKVEPQPITVPHEYPAVSMAHGYAMVTGEPQVVMVHTTVGTANALGALINAARARIPLLLAAGRTPITERGLPGSRDALIHWAQESFDQGAMVREYVKWDYELRNSAQLETVLRRVFALATAEPKGPVYLTLPREVLGEALKELEPSGGESGAEIAAVAPADEAIEKAAAMIAAAENPLVITRSLGAKPAAVPLLVSLAESFALPVIDFPMPQYVNFPSDHPLHLGFGVGPYLSSADVVVVVESDVPWLPAHHAPAPGARVIHIGADPCYSRYPIWGFPVTLALPGDPLLALARLGAALASRRRGNEAKIAARFERVRREHERQRERWRREGEARGRRGAITMEWVSACLDRLADESMIVVNDYDLRLRHFTLRRPGSYFGIPPAGCLGWGVGAALGVKLARPEKTVVAVVGDGSYIFSVPSACHMVSAMYGLPILVVICDNAGWNSPREATRGMFPKGWAARAEEYPLTRFTVEPAYSMFAEAYGGYGVRVEEPDEVPEALARALAEVRSGRQAVVHVICDRSRMRPPE